MSKRFLTTARGLALISAVLLTGGGAAFARSPAPIGGQRDDHGCLGPAGFAWCARERACVRPWELARRRGFSVSQRNFERYCRPRR
jgi:hypothetical protein